MRGIFAAIVVGLAVVQTDALRCRRCIGASTLDDCTFNLECGADEICYMDELITEQLSIEYHGGCRPKTVCLNKAPNVGKRAGSFVACSKCCETASKPECNTKLCGIKASTSGNSQCYHCAEDAGGDSSGVSDASKCTSIRSCQSDEVCGGETYRLAEKDTFEFACYNRRVCTLLTQEGLKRRKECDPKQTNNIDPLNCPTVSGKRQSGQKVCSACCGDALCNSGSCEDIVDELYNLWNFGVLDFKTLKRNGTPPAVTTTVGPGSGTT